MKLRIFGLALLSRNCASAALHTTALQSTAGSVGESSGAVPGAWGVLHRSLLKGG